MKLWHDEDFLCQLYDLMKNYSAVHYTIVFCKQVNGILRKGKIYLKREDLNHTGAHKINNVLGQIMLAHKIGKKRIVAEPGAGRMGLLQLQVVLFSTLNVRFLSVRKIWPSSC